MSEDKKTPNLGEAISEEQLDAVSGGGYLIGGSGTVTDPYREEECWFVADSSMRADGRTRCKTDCKGKFGNGRPVLVETPGQWYICRCWGTDKCVDKWHSPCGNPLRENW